MYTHMSMYLLAYILLCIYIYIYIICVFTMCSGRLERTASMMTG